MINIEPRLQFLISSACLKWLTSRGHFIQCWCSEQESFSTASFILTQQYFQQLHLYSFLTGCFLSEAFAFWRTTPTEIWFFLMSVNIMNFINKFKFKNNFSSRNLSKLVLAYFLHMRISTKTQMLNNGS